MRRIINTIVIALGMTLLCPILVVGQERTAAQKYSFSYYSQQVSGFKKWYKSSSTGEWRSSDPGKYKGPSGEKYEGAFAWDVISFNVEGKDVYAIRFKVGSFYYEYPSLQMDPHYSQGYIFYFVSFHDLLKLQEIQQGEVVTIRPYGYELYDLGEDRTVRTFIEHSYKDNGEEVMMVKLTTQSNQKVIRFTLPYEGAKLESIFEYGPYYELTLSSFERFRKSLKNLPHDREYTPSPKRSPLLDKVQYLQEDNGALNMPRYDTTSWYFDVFKLAKNNHYYDGQSISFLSAEPYPANTRTYQYLDGFMVREPQYFREYADTAWMTIKKGQRVPHVTIPKSDAYKAVYVKNEDVRSYGATLWGTDNIRRDTGFHTPISSIVGQHFSVLAACIELIRSEYNVVLLLQDKDGVEVLFYFVFYSSDEKNGYMPILMDAMCQKTLAQYQGKKFLVDGNSSAKAYVAKPIGSNDYKLASGEFTLSDIRFKSTTNHHDYITSSSRNANQSYSMYYSEPFIYFKDEDGCEYEFPLASKDEKESEYIGMDVIPGNEHRGFYYRLTMEQFKEASVVYAERQRKIDEQKAKDAEAQKKYKERLARLTKKYGKATAEEIMQGYVRIGWNKEKCTESWGKPKSVNTTTGSWGVHEQWVYGDSYLYFENGVLTAIQN